MGEGDQSKTEVPVKKVAGPTLKLIVQYLEHHKGKNGAEITKPIRSVRIEDIVEDNWDAAFISRDLTALAEIDRLLKAELADIDCENEDERRRRIEAVPIRQDVAAGSKAEIFKLILGANYMDIHPLLHLGCAKIATLIKGKSPEEIKKILGDTDAAADAQNTARENG